MYEILMFGQFALGILWVYLQVRIILFRIYGDHRNFPRLVRIHVAGSFLLTISSVHKRNPGQSTPIQPKF